MPSHDDFPQLMPIAIADQFDISIAMYLLLNFIIMIQETMVVLASLQPVTFQSTHSIAV